MRLSKVKPALLAALFAFNSLLPAYAARFNDLGSSCTEKYINDLSDKGVIPVENDGKFKPNDPVTRAALSRGSSAPWGLKISRYRHNRASRT